MTTTKVLDHGYIKLIDSWGSDEAIIEAARMSTGKGFEGWEKDEKLLAYLYKNSHWTPFEMAGMVIEVKAPIMVFREWHRHRSMCLAPGTLVHFEAPKGDREGRRYVQKMRIDDIWRKWQPTVRADRQERQTNALFPRSRIQAMRLRCLDEQAMEFVQTHIVDVVRGEPKPMVTATTTSGRRLTATREHRVFTANGWMTLGEAIKGRVLLALEGTTRAKASGWETPPADEANERWRPVVGWDDLYEVSDQGRIRRVGCAPRKLVVAASGYLAVSLNRPGEQMLRTVHRMVLEAFRGPAGVGQEARHANHNRLDARLDNLSWGTSVDNSADQVQADRNRRLVPRFEEIESVESAGELPTYDLAVDGPCHNFVACGFVVHNSYNEMSGRYVPLPNENYIPTVERLLINSKTNKQAGVVPGANELTPDTAEFFQNRLEEMYDSQERLYQAALKTGVPKELARIHLPVGRYSRMRATTNLRMWIAFLTLRMAPNAQWEIRQYANAVAEILRERFPRTMKLFDSA